MVKYFYEWTIAIAGLAVFFILVMAGFQYLTSVGDPAKMKDATGRIKSALLGLVLLLSSYLILNLINPGLTTLKMPEVEVPTDTLPGVGDIGPPNLSEPCEKAIAYSLTNYRGAETSIRRGDSESLLISKDSGSLKFFYIDEGEEKEGGLCSSELYDNPNCNGDPMTTLYSSNPNLSQLYFKKDIKCIDVKSF